MRRTTLVTVSIAGHFAVGIGLFATGVWKLERLEADRRVASIGIMIPTESAGGSPAAPAQTLEKKKEKKRVAKNVQWDKTVERDDTPVARETGGDGAGDGPGTGDDVGAGTNGPPGGECALPPCDVAAPLPDPPEPKPPEAPKLIPPAQMQALRIAGETQIHPSRVVKTQILADGNSKVIGNVKVCIDASGGVTSVGLLGSTRYPAYDDQLLAAVRSWRYRPYSIDGVAKPVCASVAFVYSIK
ncbi:MAG TPA: energy transducer TonB [Kofleriaceae bacterium]|nr:energy transducer TonB [Kofleriaceae bacterium]